MDEDLKKKLTDEEYRVLVEKGTEIPFTGKYLDNKDEGVYKCKACGEVLFKSDDKFDSGSGWPSFSDVADKSKLILTKDLSHGLDRIEVQCSNCKAHLGHVFPDYPKKGGMYYCINSVALDFEEEAEGTGG
ncbi:MAG: peptide-methionine (R)-S-oxide reductase MsrB [Candidatus Dojkabacteria bacterium]|nr:peptide-methionine (R)-S-oxide reductase MsrB [Candidatus Dojkabacteria bacterium]MDQ7020311.1 peptide-methionine (R)-S-oxide reductase MsrB [Candidatus Dojkabacteria bacterium]